MNRARSVTRMTDQMPAPLIKATSSTTERIAALALRRWPPESFFALPVIFPASLPKATTVPVKVTAPMKMPRNSSTFRM
jgi:hypothetical protein